MGSRSKINLAYIAGFLDGDGSLMIQVKKRKDGRIKTRIMLTICFYQDSRHEKPLYWIRRILEIGYIFKRNDGITELRINGFAQVFRVLSELAPFLKFKKIQAKTIMKAADLLMKKKRAALTKIDLRTLVNCIILVQNENYVAKRKKTKEKLLKILGLTP